METYIRNRTTGHRTAVVGILGDVGMKLLANMGYEADPARRRDAPRGWNGTYPFIGSDSWRGRNPGRYAIVSVNLQENGVFIPGSNVEPWQVINPRGQVEGFDTHTEALEHVLGIIHCPHEYHLSRCIGCGGPRPDDYDR